MRQRFEFEIWCPDTLVEWYKSLVEFTTKRKLTFMWLLGIAFIAFGGPTNEAGTAWGIWMGAALSLTGFLKELLRPQNGVHYETRWKILWSNLSFWYLGWTTFLYGLHDPDAIWLMGIAVLMHLIMSAIYRLTYTDEEKKARGKS